LEAKKDLYNNILRISKEIELLIQLENFDKIEELLTQRDEFVTKISKEDFKIDGLKEIVDKIKALDEKNFEQIEKFKKKISEKINKLSKNRKVIGSYKQEEIYKARLIDETNS
jgi:hypothetical protein